MFVNNLFKSQSLVRFFFHLCFSNYNSMSRNSVQRNQRFTTRTVSPPSQQNTDTRQNLESEPKNNDTLIIVCVAVGIAVSYAGSLINFHTAVCFAFGWFVARVGMRVNHDSGQ